MRLINFSYNKINIEKFSTGNKELKLKSDLNISSIEKVDSDILKTKEDLFKINFIYNIKYEPDFASLEFKGILLIAINNEDSDKILKEWKNKKMPEDFKIRLFNLILKKISVKALQLEEELNLPLHIPMPKVQKNSDK